MKELNNFYSYRVLKDTTKNPNLGQGEIFSSTQDVLKKSKVEVDNYKDLLTHVARMYYYNPKLQILFRGQSEVNYKNKITFLPTAFRDKHESKKKLEEMKEKEISLQKNYRKVALVPNPIGSNPIETNRVIRLALLQHYSICDTQLLDFTQSINVALSFAMNGKKINEHGYILIFGFSKNDEERLNKGITLIRLNEHRIPPTALRPYAQEAWLGADSTTLSEHFKFDAKCIHEFDFVRCLVGKIKVTKTNDIVNNLIKNKSLFLNNNCDEVCDFIEAIF